jgi:hypothetical protein
MSSSQDRESDRVVDRASDRDRAADVGAQAVREASAATQPRFSRALMALVGAVTLAVATPAATRVLGLAGSGDEAHTSPVYLLSQAGHDIGHNEWAFQGGVAGRVVWAAGYVGSALFWLGAALWMRARERAWQGGLAGPAAAGRLWLRTLVASWAALAAAGALTLSGALFADRTATQLGPIALRLTDACSPWWGCVAVLVVAAVAERNIVALRTAAVYWALLELFLLVPLPGPSFIKVLALAAVAALGALSRGRRSAADHEAGTGAFRSRLNRFSVARWMRASA